MILTRKNIIIRREDWLRHSAWTSLVLKCQHDSSRDRIRKIHLSSIIKITMLKESVLLEAYNGSADETRRLFMKTEYSLRYPQYIATDPYP